jgi:hypothetical protein
VVIASCTGNTLKEVLGGADSSWSAGFTSKVFDFLGTRGTRLEIDELVNFQQQPTRNQIIGGGVVEIHTTVRPDMLPDD